MQDLKASYYSPRFIKVNSIKQLRAETMQCGKSRGTKRERDQGESTEEALDSAWTNRSVYMYFWQCIV